ncbi:MAG: hypothetical protein N2712_04100 [Brevinematales bacterium]|nr:hypothetical protein [Brevinematales bacterium]
MIRLLILVLYIILFSIIPFITKSQEIVFLTNYNPYTNRTYLITNFTYRGISIGMMRSNVEKIIEEDEFLEVDETSYLGLFDKDKPFVLKAVALPYVRSAYFSFDKGILFNMIINFNPAIYSYSELLADAKKKYDLPTDEYPNFAVWSFPPYELRVEKPSTVKFFLTKEISNIIIREYESSKKIKERAEYSKKELSPFR